MDPSGPTNGPEDLKPPSKGYVRGWIHGHLRAHWVFAVLRHREHGSGDDRKTRNLTTLEVFFIDGRRDHLDSMPRVCTRRPAALYSTRIDERNHHQHIFQSSICGNFLHSSTKRSPWEGRPILVLDTICCTRSALLRDILQLLRSSWNEIFG